MAESFSGQGEIVSNKDPHQIATSSSTPQTSTLVFPGEQWHEWEAKSVHVGVIPHEGTSRIITHKRGPLKLGSTLRTRGCRIFIGESGDQEWQKQWVQELLKHPGTKVTEDGKSLDVEWNNEDPSPLELLDKK